MNTELCTQDGFSIESIELDPKHPGINDPAYISRRSYFYHTCRASRIRGSGMPSFDYSLEERRVWRVVLERLEEAHQESACSLYLKAKKTLGISPNEIPQPGAVNPMLSSLTRFQLAPAEGLLDVDDFLHGLANRRFPCTQYLRHGSDPAFTPEPDMVHDLVGHVPLLVDPAYASLIARMGQISLEARDEQLLSLQRFYWFGIEFGLLEESGVCKVFGSGLLSSYGETEHALSSDVEKRPFRLDEVVQTQFDPTRMQDLLFVIPSFEFLHAELSRLGELLSRNR